MEFVYAPRGRPRAASIQSWKPQATESGSRIVSEWAFVSPLFCFLLIGATLPLMAAQVQSDAVPPLPDRNPMRSAAPAPAKPVLPSEQPTVPWSEAEIDAAKAKCKELLTGDSLDYEMLPPIKEGICGTPAPVLLHAVGSDPKVMIDPPATLSCPMAHVLGVWLGDTVQREAKKLFGSTVIKIHNATSYACRNRYGGANTPLSEHALANAVDVSEFVLANGVRITILDSWPKPVVATPAPAESSSSRTAEGSAAPTPKPADRTASTTATKTSAVTAAKAEPTAALSPPPVAAEPGPKAQFVTFLHEHACRRFGTVLGPEANAAHKNHFHLDMKTRPKSFCE
jgi:hypothetical protein